MFKRRKPRSYSQLATEMIYPRGGWKRAGRYVLHRMRRLPDQPSRIGLGFACGIFISFTPFFGFHFLGAAGLAWLFGGNLIAALLGTFIGNPVTTPFMALASISTGRWLLGSEGAIAVKKLPGEFARAGAEIWHNIRALFTEQQMHWGHLAWFYHEVFLPYAIGSIIPGVVAGAAGYYLTVPLIRAYHKRREKKMADRIAALRMMGADQAEGAMLFKAGTLPAEGAAPLAATPTPQASAGSEPVTPNAPVTPPAPRPPASED